MRVYQFPQGLLGEVAEGFMQEELGGFGGVTEAVFTDVYALTAGRVRVCRRGEGEGGIGVVVTGYGLEWVGGCVPGGY